MTLHHNEFIGRRIQVMVPGRDQQGRRTPHRLVPMRGHCSFAGPNHILGIAFQVTLYRMPLFDVDPSTIKIC